jgi:hypothetical protein
LRKNVGTPVILGRTMDNVDFVVLNNQALGCSKLQKSVLKSSPPSLTL